MLVDRGINLDLPAAASQKPRLPKRSQILALIRTHVAQRTEGQEYRVNVLVPGQVDTPDSQRLDKATREMFESPGERWVVLRELRRSRCFLLQAIRAS